MLIRGQDACDIGHTRSIQTEEIGRNWQCKTSLSTFNDKPQAPSFRTAVTGSGRKHRQAFD